MDNSLATQEQGTIKHAGCLKSRFLSVRIFY